MWAEQERMVYGANWGFVLANDHKGKAHRKWMSIRSKVNPSKREKGLTGAALEAAVMGIALADPSLVKIEQAGAN